jgi:hypothetical protein
VFRLRDAGDGMSPSSPHRRQSHLSHARDDWIVRLILAVTDTATIRRSGGPHQQRSMVRNTGMNPRKFGIICVLLTATPNLLGCGSSGSQDYQFEKQVKRAQECRQLQEKLVSDQPLMPERAEEITKTMGRSGCTARLPA